MLYLKLLLIGLWILVVAFLGLFLAPLRLANTDLNALYARMLAWGMLRIAGIRLEVEGLESLEAHQPCVYVGNHQSGFDMATFGTHFPRRTLVIGKKELIWIPFFGVMFWAGGNIMINRQKRVSAIAELDQTIDKATRNRASIFVFPEGTRNRSSELLLPFKKGAFHMAIRAQYPIVPIACQPLGEMISWERRRINGGTVRMRVLPPISTKGLTAADVTELARVTRERIHEAVLGLATHRP